MRPNIKASMWQEHSPSGILLPPEGASRGKKSRMVEPSNGVRYTHAVQGGTLKMGMEPFRADGSIGWQRLGCVHDTKLSFVRF